LRYQFSEDYLRAISLAELKISEIELNGFPPIGREEGVFKDFPRFRWVKNVSETLFTDIRKVDITIIWKQGNKVQEYSLTTYLGRGA